MHVEKDTLRDDSPSLGYWIVAVTVSEGGTVLRYSLFFSLREKSLACHNFSFSIVRLDSHHDVQDCYSSLSIGFAKSFISR